MSKKVVTVEQLLENARQSEALTIQVAEAAAAAIEGKQDKLTGTAGQIVGFNADGDAVAQEPGGGNDIKLVKHYAKVLAGNGDTDKIESTSYFSEDYVRFVICNITGVGDIVDPNTGNKMHYGNIHISANIRPSWQLDASSGAQIGFRLRFSNAENKRLVLNEEFSLSSGRMMSFQGAPLFGGDDIAAQEDGRFLRGVYADVNLSNHLEDEDDKYVLVEFRPVQIIRGDLNYTYWIEWQTPICWTYE